MKFVPAHLEDQLGFQHPEVAKLARDFDAQHWKWKADDATFPDCTVTCLERDEAKNAAVTGKPKSWHLVRCAVDFRSKHYDFKQAAKCIDWLRERCPQPFWELVLIPHGTGPHFHVAYRDFSWRRAGGKP